MIQIKRITPKNLINQLRLQNFQVGIIQAKNANKIIQFLKIQETLPLDAFFLKRIRKIVQAQQNKKSPYVQILLCLSEQKDQFIQKIKSNLNKIFNQKVLKEIKTVRLPRQAPSSKNDLHRWTKYWPCNFCQPEFIKEITHSKEELIFLHQICNMIKSEQLEKSIKKSSLLKPELVLFQGQKCLFRLQLDNISNNCKNRSPLQHPIMILTQKWPHQQMFKNNPELFYYLTKLQLIIKLNDLCGMCAMALVHSRVQRIYFYDYLPKQEILQILYSQKLNHKINLFELKTDQTNHLK